MKASIYKSELEFIAKCVLDYDDLETGGDLFGYWDKNGNPVVQYVTGPGKATIRTRSSFFQDIPYLHECVQYFYKNYALEQIGSWHSHNTMSLPHPSGGDEATMKNCLNTYSINKFLIVICSITPNKEVNINGFIFSNTNRNVIYEDVKWITLLAKENPIRKYVDKNAKFIKNPKTRRASYRIQREYPDDFNIIDQNIQPSQKPNLPSDYYFNTKEGQAFLKKEFDKLDAHPETSNVEIIFDKDEDSTISITFDWGNKNYKVNYPLDFSKENPKPIIKEEVITLEKSKQKERKEEYIIVETNSARINFVSFIKGIILNFKF